MATYQRILVVVDLSEDDPEVVRRARELASACGIEEAAARKRVSRAIARLREIAVKE